MSFTSFFQLIRWKNLLFIVASQFLIKFLLIPKFESSSVFSVNDFLLLTISTLLISAAGYIINDIFDIRVDKINKRKSSLTNNSISLKTAWFYYYFLNSLGLILGVWVSIKTNQTIFSLFFISIVLILYAYSKKLKTKPLLGNILIASLLGFCILIIAFFERFQINSYIFKIIFTYSLFAFLVNLIREIIKDIEDVNGDYVEGMKTLPILIGRKRTRNFSVILSILFAVLLITILILNKHISTLILYYGLILIVLPLLYFISKLTSAKSKKEYHKLSLLLKGIMVLGILSIFAL